MNALFILLLFKATSLRDSPPRANTNDEFIWEVILEYKFFHFHFFFSFFFLFYSFTMI